jgi:site-specific recombinase XerD
MLGHQKLETTMIYTRVSLAKLREVHAACHPAG